MMRENLFYAHFLGRGKQIDSSFAYLWRELVPQPYFVSLLGGCLARGRMIQNPD